MKESIYIHATKKAWHFTLKHKILWIFGAFAAFLGQFGVVEFLGKLGVHEGKAESYFGTIGNMLTQAGRFVISASNSYDSKTILFFLLTLVFGIFLVFVFFAVVSQGLLLHAESQAIRDRKESFVKSWHVSSANFWRLFFLNFFKKIILAVITVIISLSAYGVLLTPSITNSIFFTLVVILFSIVGLVLSFLFFYSACYLVIEKENLSLAIQRAWMMFVRHPVVSFEISILVLIYNLFFGLFTALGFILLILPAVLFWFVVVLLGGGQIALVAAFVAALIMFTMYIIVAGAAFTVFITYIWTYTFVEMHDKGIKSRVMKFVRHLRNKLNKK